MDRLLQLVKEVKAIDEYQITQKVITSKELFFIKDKLQMNRGKDVTHTTVVVFKNFEEDGKKYKGLASTQIKASDTDEEITSKLKKAIFSAQFVKNDYYELVTPQGDSDSTFEEKTTDLTVKITKLIKDLYQEGNQFGAFLNSTEFFINKETSRIVNSNGVDVKTSSTPFEVEIITEASNDLDSVELFDVLHFTDYNEEWLKETVKESLHQTKLRLEAVPMPKVEDIPVILSGESVVQFLNYYSFHVDGASKYNHYHENKIGDHLQGEDIIGDKVTMVKTPMLSNSTYSSKYDADGVLLEETEVISEGVLKAILASNRYAYYLGIKPTGMIGNTIYSGGSKSVKELKQGPYLELLKFSAFQMDRFTGNFGGEFRLGIYYDGEKEIPVTLGSISGNIKVSQKEMYLSKETTQMNRFIAPKIIKLKDVVIAGE